MKRFKLFFVLCCFLWFPAVWPDDVSFAVVSDIHKAQASWLDCLNELKRQEVDLVLVTGDMAPDSDRHIDFENIFYMAPKTPVLLPVPGNHELDDGMENYEFMRDKILPQIKGISRHSLDDCTYYYDFNGSRFIGVDGYVNFGSHGVINEEGREWVRMAIEISPDTIKHIFIFFHEPAYPQFRHVGDSFDEDPFLRDGFLIMLERYPKVAGIFVGHTHYYYRSEHGNIWQVSSGSIGNNKDTTFVVVKAGDEGVGFQAYRKQKDPQGSYTVFDEWEAANRLTTTP